MLDQRERDRLSNIQAVFKRMFSGEDSETAIQFIEHMAGITDFVPTANLEKVEGLKRFRILLGKMLNSNTENWLKWYDDKGRNLYV